MGRRKAVGATRSQTVELTMVDVHADDPIPDFALDFFQRQYAGDSDGNERPAKRRRTESERSVDSVTIMREELVIQRPADGQFVDVEAFHLHDLQALLRFELSDMVDMESDNDHVESQFLAISTRPSLKKDRFSLTFPLEPGSLSNQLAAILSTRDTFWSNPHVEDLTWISAAADLEADAATTTLTLSFQVHWNISTTTYAPPLSPHQRKFRREMLALAFPDMFGIAGGQQTNSCSPQVFYEAAHVPDPDDTPPADALIPQMATKLYPFQRRAVRWMLKREGVQWSQDEGGNSIINTIPHDRFDAPSSFVKTKDVDGGIFFISPLLGKATKDMQPFNEVEQNFRGGILSEEMGLGKTVELLALFSLHQPPSRPDETFDNYLGELIKTTPATLIVAPSSLKKQWLSELNKHAPGLRVMLYTGISQSAREEESKASALMDKLRSQDVVVTTYNVLTSELDYALGEPDRARRKPRKYHRPRSPLTQLCWWRVCMDEAQMIESGVSKAATLARLIPRVNAWGVTGTPVKDSVEDLHGLLLFLRYEPFASNIQAWNNLIRSHRDGFERLFNQLSLRHSKRLVRHEIAIPPQKRYVITMPFTAVEEQHYQSLFKEVVEACGLGSTGEPLRDDWDPEDPGVLEKMRTALDRLRQTALHPEVGTRNRRALGHRNGPMRTVAEVLDVMIEQSEVSIRTDQRALFLAKLTRGQLMENSPRVTTALEIWQGVLAACAENVDECRKHLRREIELAKAASADATRATDEESDHDIDENNTGRVGDARRRLRSALEIQHKAMFFMANAHFQIKSNPDMTQPDSDEFHRLEKLETDGYQQAKVARREILEESRTKALKLMKKISVSAAKQSFAVIPEYKTLDKRGIESRNIVEDLETLAGDLNAQADRLDDWREHVIQILSKPLVDEEDDADLTGQEYEDSTMLMEETVVYIQILRTAIADREDVMSGQVNQLVKHEAKTSLRLAKEGEGPLPEKFIELFALRNQVKPHAQRSLRAAVWELRAATAKLRTDADNGSHRARAELDILTEQMKSTQKQLGEQQKAAVAMNQELDLFTATMNARVEFYRQLQGVSDSVAPYDGPMGPAEETRLLGLEETLDRKLEASQAKHRYLLNLKATDATSGEQRMCVICRENFTIGVLTVCGHQYCKPCIGLWFKANHNCPVCKKRLHTSSMHDITLKPQELKVHSESSGAGPSSQKPSDKHMRTNPSSSRKTAIYNEFSADKLAEIKNIDLDGPAFTTKVDNLVRHLLWLRENDPGAKSIIFSQYADFLSVLGLAFRRYRIGFTSFERPTGIADFQEDPSMEVFLLHARAHASGLNLTNASHVFLMEPLVNTALELQAIARVHRIGQVHETTVWLYIVDGTVEESIYHLSARRRMEHVGQHNNNNKNNNRRGTHRRDDARGKSRGEDPSSTATPELADEAIEAANSMELEHASLSKLMGRGRAQGEAVDKGDLWECLFGHVSGSGDGDGRGRREVKNPDPAIRGFLAAEAAERRRQEAHVDAVVADDGEGGGDGDGEGDETSSGDEDVD